MPLSEFPRALETSSGNDAPLLRTVPPGPLSQGAAKRLEAVECPAFGARRRLRATEASDEMALPIVLASGRGSNLYDVDGNRYVDLVAGFGSALLGHSASAVLRALEAQSERLVQGLGDVYGTDTKLALLERVAKLHPGDKPRVLLGQSGSDAVTAALKTAMLVNSKPGVLAFEGAYHGLGYAPLPTCGFRETFRRPFAPQLNPHVRFCSYPGQPSQVDQALDQVEAELRKGDVGAILFEPILGRGGCVVPPDSFLVELCKLGRQYGSVTIADEIWTGLGRAGSMARSVDLGCEVDLLCFGKGLGGGAPISACVGTSSVMESWTKFPEVIHTSTHSGAPLACAAAVATLDTLRFRKLPERGQELGDRARAFMADRLGRLPSVRHVRGAGLLIGIELDSSRTANRCVFEMLKKGFVILTGGVRGEVLTLTPALTIEEELLELASSALKDVLSS